MSHHVIVLTIADKKQETAEYRTDYSITVTDEHGKFIRCLLNNASQRRAIRCAM